MLILILRGHRVRKTLISNDLSLIVDGRMFSVPREQKILDETGIPRV